MTLSGLEIGELCFLHLFKLRELLGTCHVPFACYAELVDTADQRLNANCSPTLTIFEILPTLTIASYGFKLFASALDLLSRFQKVLNNYCDATGTASTLKYF